MQAQMKSNKKDSQRVRNVFKRYSNKQEYCNLTPLPL